MKKILAFIVMAAILVCPALASGEAPAAAESADVAGIAAAAAATAQENHNFVVEVTKAATCVDKGLLTYTCSDCGLTYTVETLPTGQHDYVAAVTEPTCTEDGATVYTCSVCGDTYSEPIPATGHVPSAEAPTCTEGVVCTVCGELLAAATGHDYAYQYDAVQNEDGTFASYGTWMCANCGDVLDATEGNAVYYYSEAVQGEASAEASEEAEEAAALANPNYDPEAHNWAGIEITMLIVIVVVGAVLMLSFGKAKPAKKED